MKAYLVPGEVELLEEATTNLRDSLLVRLLYRLGCRISEALGISVQDIDFEQETVTIEHLKARINLSCPDCGTRLGKKHKFCPGCGVGVEKALAQEKEHRRVRTLPIDHTTLEMLKEYIIRGGPVVTGGRQFIFGLSRGHAWKIVRDCAEKAGLEKLVNPETGRVHNVRGIFFPLDAHAVTAQRDDSTDGIRMLQEQLGHASIGTTMKYRKVSGQEHRKWYNELWEE